MNDLESQEHAWVRGRLLPYLASQLDLEDTARIEAHLLACDACESLAESLRATGGPEHAGDHIPAGLLAKWPHVVSSIRGAERAAIRAHLESCTDCRSTLEVLGQEAVLPVIAELEPTAAVAEAFGAPSPRSEAARSREEHAARPERARPAHDWLRWALGSWGLAATTAALLIARVGSVAPPTLPLVTLGTVSRGVIEVPRGARLLPLQIPADRVAAPVSASVVVTVVGPGLSRTYRGSLSEYVAPQVVLLGGGRALRPGSYRLTVSAAGAPDTLFAEDFEVVARE